MPRFKVVHTETLTTGDINTTAYSAAISLDGAQTFSAQCSIDVDTPAAKTFTDTDVDVVTNIITIASHGFTTGDKGQLTTTGTLPDGLAISTDYFIISLTSGTIAFASSLANALAGTKIDLIDAGSAAATNTFTPTAIAGATVKLQKSNDATNWSDEGSATNITADGIVWLEKIDPTALYMRIAFTMTAGQLSCSTVVVARGVG